MYEENLSPLPTGDASVVFAKELSEVAQCGQRSCPRGQDHVVHWATKEMQAPFAAICRKLLLPGSGIKGWEHVQELSLLARRGESCLLCLSHNSNLDVPTLYAILEDQADVEIFRQIIWIAGRKLSEDEPLTQTLIQSCNRIDVTPPSWFSKDHSDEELQDAHRMNRAAQRELVKLRNQGWIFGLFPAGTRRRPGDESTAHAIPETDTYVKRFDCMVLGTIEGCTLPVTRDRDFTHETPVRDRVIYYFGNVVRTEAWRANALRRFPDLNQRQATAHAIDDAMAALASQNC